MHSLLKRQLKHCFGETFAIPREWERFIEANAYRVAYDVVDAPAVLYAHQAELKAAREIWPKIEFHTMREHGGLVVHSNRIAA